MNHRSSIPFGLVLLTLLGSARVLQAKENPADERAASSVYIEGLGPGLFYSLNYDHLVQDDIALRVGFSYLSVSATATTAEGTASGNASLIMVPITASYLGIGGTNNFLELGGGVTVLHFGAGASAPGVEDASASATVPLGTVLVGYRLQPKRGGFNFRVGASPLFGFGSSFGVLPWGYLSLGATF